jgi:hypothetical protein
VGCAAACCRSIMVVSSTTASCSATVFVIGYASRAAMVASSAFTAEAVSAPAVAVSPAAPGSHAQEDAVVEVAGAVITHRRASVRRISVIPVGTNRLNSDVNHDLSVGRWHYSQTGQQCRRTDKCFESAHK